MKKRVICARQIQKERFMGKGITLNAQMNPAQIELYCRLAPQEKKLMERAFERLNLSARAYHRILRVARTIADLEGGDSISSMHLAEAVQYRSLDRKYWN